MSKREHKQTIINQDKAEGVMTVLTVQSFRYDIRNLLGQIGSCLNVIVYAITGRKPV